MTARSYAKSTQTVDTILGVARRLFLQSNYADVTVADIAQEAGVTKGALYHHFASKEDIYLEMMRRVLADVATVRGEDAGAAAPSRERLRRLVLSFMQLPDETRRVVALLRRDINIFRNPARDTLVRAYQRALPEHVEAIIRQGIARGDIVPFDARLLSWAHVALVEVALKPYGDALFATPEAKADFLVSLFFDGVAVRQAEEQPCYAV